jgi:FHA domain
VGQAVELVYEYIRKRELMAKGAFVADMNAHFLLYKRWQVKNVGERTQTQIRVMPPAALMDLLEEQKLQLHKEAFEYRVVKLSLDGSSGWQIGRTSENDIVVPHHTVSKKHALITLGADASMMIADQGSKNGTWVENKRVMPDRPTLIWTKQVLRLGTLSIRFLGGGDFYDILGGMVTPA